MTAIKLKLPPGIYKNGTPYSLAGRWADCHLMRWVNGVAQTIGGWQQKVALEPTVGIKLNIATNEAVRAGIPITDLFDFVRVYLGSNLEIYQMLYSGAVTVVTPTGFVEQQKDAAQTAGYGLGAYGMYSYGTPRPATLSAQPLVFSWGFTSWGEDAIACARGVKDAPLYIQETPNDLFSPMVGTPVGAYDVLVTDERIVMTVGDATDVRLVQWSDRENNADWVPSVTNMAGFYRLPGKGRLLCIKQVQGQILILSDNEAFAGQFLGPPYVYGFNKIGDNCGAVSALSVTVENSVAYWFGNDTFWKYDGVLQALPCPMLQFFLNDLNMAQRTKVTAMSNSAFNEIWWLYQSATNDDCDSYIIYNYAENLWYGGKIDRTFGLDSVPLRYVTMVSRDGFVYDHEIPNAGWPLWIDGEKAYDTPWIYSGPLETQNGERLFGMSYVFPDDSASVDLTMELELRNMPKEDPTRIEFYKLLNPTSTIGIMARDIRVSFYNEETNEQWQLGDVRVTPVAAPTGRR